MTKSLNRRAFLKLVSMAGTFAVVRGLLTSAKKVVVIGAGLAGLAAAWNLMENGYDVVVFEAQEIPGGRVKTVRESFKNGSYSEEVQSESLIVIAGP
jgi:monoamine oxidase